LIANSVEEAEQLDDTGPSGNFDAFDEPTILEGTEETGTTDAAAPLTGKTEQSTETTQTNAADELKADKQDELEADKADPFEGYDERAITEFKKLGVTDPKDPTQLAKIDVARLIARLAEKDKLIESGKTPKSQGSEEKPIAAKVIDFTEGLPKPKGATDGAPAQPNATEAANVPTNGRPAETATEGKRPLFNDGFDAWTDFPDAYKARDEAYVAGDLDQVQKIEAAIFTRNNYVQEQKLTQKFQGLLQEALGKFRDTELAEVFQPAQAAKAETEANDDRKWASNVLRQPDSGLAVPLDDLLKDTGGTIEHEGESYPDTLYNRVMLKHPEIADIVKTDPDKRVAFRKTIIAKAQAVAKIAKLMDKPAVDPNKANELVEAGRRQAEADQRNKANDKTRQTLNGGRTSSTGGSTKTAAEEMAERVVSSSGSPFDNFGT
jgi:hypothetical protein